MMTDLPRTLLDMLCPRSCVGCGQPAGPEALYFCWDCLQGIRWVQEPFCLRCGDPIAGVVSPPYECSLCRSDPPAFERARSAARYEGVLQAAIQEFKYGQATHLSGDFGRFLEACVRVHYPRVSFDGVVFVPLYPRKERERTYNQARLLAGELGRRLGIPVLSRCLRRVRATGTQTKLTAAQRAANVKGAFEAVQPEWIEGRSLLLVDDVMTTGATLRECARVLRGAGAWRVFLATVARG